MPIGIDIVEPPMLAAAQAAEGITVRDGQRIMLNAREVKSIDEIMLLNTACAQVDGAYSADRGEAQAGHPREPARGGGHQQLDLQARSTSTTSTRCRVSAALPTRTCSATGLHLGPGDRALLRHHPDVRGLQDLLLPTFVVGKASDAQRDAYKQAREHRQGYRADGPGQDDRQGRVGVAQGDRLRLLLGDGGAFGLQFGHSVGLFLHRAAEYVSRLNSIEHPEEIKEGMVIALETYCPAKDGISAARIEEEVVVTAHGPQAITRSSSAELFVANAY
ncbi:MAG: M24 family metallopeptidase [Chloroflexota bacterium]